MRDVHKYDGEQHFVSYFALRIAVGVAGLLMPIAVRLGAWHFEGVSDLSTISAHYYTGMREVFVGSLVLAGTVLACYRTRSAIDLWLGVMAGVAAIGIALFPMEPTFGKAITDTIPGLQNGECLRDKTCYFNHGILGFHGYFVGAFFFLAFVLMWFRFPAFTPNNPTPEKLTRNKVYRVCAVVMALAGIVLGFFSVREYALGMFWSESVAVMAFAIAWLVKGQLFLADPQTPDRERLREPLHLHSEQL